jgi:hypothetical protein
MTSHKPNGDAATVSALALGVVGVGLCIGTYLYSISQDPVHRKLKTELDAIIVQNRSLGDSALGEYTSSSGTHLNPIITVTKSGRTSNVTHGTRLTKIVPGTGISGPTLNVRQPNGAWSLTPSSLGASTHILADLTCGPSGNVIAAIATSNPVLKGFLPQAPLSGGLDSATHEATLGLAPVTGLQSGTYVAATAVFDSKGRVISVSSGAGAPVHGEIRVHQSSGAVSFPTEFDKIPRVTAISDYLGGAHERRINTNTHGFTLTSDLDRHVTYIEGEYNLLDMRRTNDTERLMLLLQHHATKAVYISLQKEDGKRDFLMPVSPTAAPFVVDDAKFPIHVNESALAIFAVVGRVVYWTMGGSTPVIVSMIGNQGDGDITELAVLDSGGANPCCIVSNDAVCLVELCSNPVGFSGWEETIVHIDRPVYGISAAVDFENLGESAPHGCTFLDSVGAIGSALALSWHVQGSKIKQSPIPFTATNAPDTRVCRTSSRLDVVTGRVYCAYVNPDDTLVYVDSWIAADGTNWVTHGHVSADAATVAPLIVLCENEMTVAYQDASGASWTRTVSTLNPVQADWDSAIVMPLGGNQENSSTGFQIAIVNLHLDGIGRVPEIAMTRKFSGSGTHRVIGYSPIVHTSWRALVTL